MEKDDSLVYLLLLLEEYIMAGCGCLLVIVAAIVAMIWITAIHITVVILSVALKVLAVIAAVACAIFVVSIFVSK